MLQHRPASKADSALARWGSLMAAVAVFVFLALMCGQPQAATARSHVDWPATTQVTAP